MKRYKTNDGVIVKVGDYVMDALFGEGYVITDITDELIYMDELEYNEDTDDYEKNGAERKLTPAEFNNKIMFY